MNAYTSGVEEKMVDAIENGKIVRVSEMYAKREGLMILRRPMQTRYSAGELTERIMKRKKEEDGVRFGIDTFRKPLRGRNQVINELKDNFHWELLAARKRRNLTRKQVAESLHESENSIKMVENGILPFADFVLVSKLEAFYKVNLRKDGKDFVASPRDMVRSPPPEQAKPQEKKEMKSEEVSEDHVGDSASEGEDDLSGLGIELFDE